MPERPSDPSVTQQVKFDAICMQFEQAWRHGEPPSIESFLDGLPEAERPLLVSQLMLLELEYLERTGTPPKINEYLSRFPDQQTVVRRAFDEHAAALAREGQNKHAPAPAVASPFGKANRDGTTDHNPNAERPGSQIGHYKLLEQIGEGGMGVVYMAEQQRPVRRKVAVKIIKPGMDSKQVIARFEAERQALAMMDHPNIARVLDAGSTQSHRPYFVMELVRGIPITEYCDQNKLATNARLELFISVCQAVQHAHQKGIIHRDIKPTNVLVTLHDGVPIPKIIDFGVAKATNQQLTERTLFTAFAQMVGTPLYMSPEQAEMSGLDVDTRSDIYSLGVLLYELLTGATPFDRKRISTAAYDEIRRIIREEEPVKPSTMISTLGENSQAVCAQRKTDASHLRQLLRGELDWIVMKSLEKDRTRRYQTARGLAADVSRHLAGEAVQACPPTLGYRFRKFVRRYKAAATVASLFLLLLVASSVVAWILFANARQARNVAIAASAEALEAQQNALAAKDEIQTQKDRAEENFQLAERRRQESGRLTEELQRRLYDYNLIKAAAAYRENDISRTSQLLGDCLDEQRGWEWFRLNRLTAAQRTLRLTETPYTAFAVSPVAPRIVVADDTGNCRLYDLDNGQQIRSVATGIQQGATVAFSPSGDLIVLVYVGGPARPDRGRLEVWEVATGKKVWETSSDEMILFASFSPDSRQLAFGDIDMNTGKGAVSLIDLRNQKLVWKQPTPGRGPAFTAFAPNGEHLFIIVATGGPPGSIGSSLHCWSVEGPAETWSVSPVATALPCPTPDGTQLVIGGPGHSLQIRNAATGRLLQETSGSHSDSAFWLEFSHDGRYLGSVGHLGRVVLRDWQTKRELQSIDVPPTVVTYAVMAFTSASDQFVVASESGRSVELRDVNPSPAEMNLAGHEQIVKGVSFSPDGEQVLSTSMDGTLRTWSPATGQELKTHSAHPTAPALAYSPQGNYIATGGSDGAKLWSTQTGELVHDWPQAGEVWWIDFSPDGKRIITGGSKKVLMLFDVATGQELLARETPARIEGLVFCADGRRAVSLMEFTGQLDVWDLESGDAEQLRAATDNALVRCLVRSPQGNIVAAGINSTINGAIELWDVDRKQQVTTLQGHDETVECVTFNRDGSRLFSGDTAGVIKVWNIDTGEQLFSMQAHEAVDDSRDGKVGVQSLALSPDGKTLASAGGDRLVKLWETTRPTSAVADTRRVVQQATQIVDEQYRQSGSQRAVLESVFQDDSLSKEVLAMAVEIANARGDRPRAIQISSEPPPIESKLVDVRRNLSDASRSLVEMIEAASGVDFNQADVNTTKGITAADWYWSSVGFANPAYFSLEELKFLLGPLVDSYPHAHQFVLVRGQAFARHNHWPEAEADFSAALVRVPEKSDLWHNIAYRLAFIHVKAGSLDRYHALCEKALLDFGDTRDTQVLERISRMCLFSPHIGVDVERAARLADRAMEMVDTSIFRWYSLAHGIAEYRRGNWRMAIEILRQARQSSGDQYRNVMSLLYQALAYQKSAQHDLAQQMLAAAEEVLHADGYPQLDDATGTPSWNDWLNARIAHEEVKQLFQEANQTSSDRSPSEETSVAIDSEAQRIVPPDSVWKWLHPSGGVDPATEDPDFHSTFFAMTYDDTDWQTGRDSPGPRGGFGYGDPAGVELKVPLEEHRKTAYFRHRFTTDRAYDQLKIAMQHDDGVIVYLDGEEVRRNNVGDAAEAYDLFAETTVPTAMEKWVGFYKLPGTLQPGEHVLAISVHNRPTGSSDLRLAEVSLWGAPEDSAAEAAWR